MSNLIREVDKSFNYIVSYYQFLVEEDKSDETVVEIKKVVKCNLEMSLVQLSLLFRELRINHRKKRDICFFNAADLKIEKAIESLSGINKGEIIDNLNEVSMQLSKISQKINL